jgi:hypothetical protein
MICMYELNSCRDKKKIADSVKKKYRTVLPKNHVSNHAQLCHMIWGKRLCTHLFLIQMAAAVDTSSRSKVAYKVIHSRWQLCMAVNLPYCKTRAVYGYNEMPFTKISMAN